MVMLAGVVVGGLWTLYHRDQIQSPADVFRLAAKQLSVWNASFGWTNEAPENKQDRSGLRVATFNIRVPLRERASLPTAVQTIGHIVREFDVIALQFGGDDSVYLEDIIAAANQGYGGRYEFVTDGSKGREPNRQRAAFVFDSARVQMDYAVSYALLDPDTVTSNPPFVGWFRAMEAPPDQAFTFSLVNVQFNAQSPMLELAHIREIFRAVRRDGREEDDVILAGDFHVGDQGFAHLRRYGYHWIASQVPTNTRYTEQSANLLFDPRSTSEFRGAGGVFNFVKHFNLPLAEALAVAESMPVWGEFSIYEGYEMGQAADSDPTGISLR